MNSVFVNALIPVNTMKIMSMNTKMTPIEPTFMKMLRSFLLQMTANARNKTKAQ